MKFKITQRELKKMSKCCASKNRKMLQNIFATVKGAKIELAATDGAILAVRQIDVELEGTPDGFQTVIPAELGAKFNSNAIIEISSTGEKDTYRARDIVSGSDIFYTAPQNPARPNYEMILAELDKAQGAREYAVFMPDILKKVETLLDWYDFQNIVPRTTGRNRVHFWVNECYTIAAIPCRS